MFVKSISYEKLKNLGDYNNERVSVEVALNEGESEVDAIGRAKKFVEQQLRSKDEPFAVTRARQVVVDPDNHTPNQVKEAQTKVDEWESENSSENAAF